MAKKTVVQFSASWMPGEKEKDDAHRAFSGVIQVVDGKPTNHPAHVVLREREDDQPSWWPGLTDPAKKQITYGPAFADEYPYTTDLHQIKIAKGSVFAITDKEGTVVCYRIENVQDLTA